MIDELPDRCACGVALEWAISAVGVPVPLELHPDALDGGGWATDGLVAHLGRMRPTVRRDPAGDRRSHFAVGACPLDRVPNHKPSKKVKA